MTFHDRQQEAKLPWDRKLIAIALNVQPRWKRYVGMILVIVLLVSVVGGASALMGAPYIFAKLWAAICDAAQTHPAIKMAVPLAVGFVGWLFYIVRTHVQIVYGMFEIVFGAVASAGMFYRDRKDGVVCGLIFGTCVYVIVRGFDNTAKAIRDQEAFRATTSPAAGAPK